MQPATAAESRPLERSGMNAFAKTVTTGKRQVVAVFAVKRIDAPALFQEICKNYAIAVYEDNRFRVL